jgi:homoserine dehydrogenase
MRTIRVAVAGLGFVGRETVRLLAANGPKFKRRLGAAVELSAVCDRRVEAEARALGLGRSILRTRDPQELLKSEADVIVELLGGLEAPRRLVLGALGMGRHVVTANKRLLSHCWGPVQRAALKGGGRLYFEGSVAGGIPLIQSLDNGLAAASIEQVYGILNGTTNYILSRAEAGLNMEEALLEAQEKGFAEKDPAMDLSGRDTAQKISVLASLITGAWVKPKDIVREGIGRIEKQDIDFARDTLGCAVRLLGSLKLAGSDPVRVESSVFPTLVPLDHPLAAVRREYNAVLVKTSQAGDIMLYGKGAGPGPTASAVVGDIFMLARDILGGLPAGRQPSSRATILPDNRSVSSFYLRLLARDRPGVLARITLALGRRGVSISTIHQSGRPAAAGLPIVLTTHPTSHGRFAEALGEILGFPFVSARHTVMRMLP